MNNAPLSTFQLNVTEAELIELRACLRSRHEELLARQMHAQDVYYTSGGLQIHLDHWLQAKDSADLFKVLVNKVG